MPKKIIKGTRLKVLQEVTDYLEEIELCELKEKTEIYVITIEENRNILQNNLIHSALRLLAEEMGEEDLEKLKRDLKDIKGLYTDYVVDTKYGRVTTREYQSTADFSKKQISEFYDFICRQALENFNLDIHAILEPLFRKEDDDLGSIKKQKSKKSKYF